MATLRTKRASEKHIEYFALLDACNEKGCPICRLLKQSATARITELLYEEVNDPYVREHLRSSFGFCSTHAMMLIESGDSLGISLIYRDLLEQVLKAVNERNPKDMLPSQECPICESHNDATKQYIGTLLRHINDRELREQLERSTGLCLIHTAEAVKSVPDNELRQWLLHLSTQSLQKLRAHVLNFVQKHEVNRSHEQVTDEEQHSCQDAIDMLVGKNV